MNSFLLKHKWLKYLAGSFIVALGVLIIVLGCINPGTVPAIVNIVIASSFLIVGLVLLLIAIFNETHKVFTLTFIIGVAALTVGIAMLVSRFHLGFVIGADFVVYIISLLTLVLGGAALFKAISLIVYKEKGILITLMFLVAVAGITLGILGLCFAPKLVTAAYIILGVALLVIGILAIVFAAIGTKKKA